VLHPYRRFLPRIDWIDQPKRRIDERALWASVEERFDAPEFGGKPCENRVRCREIVKAFRRRCRREKLDELYRKRWQRQAENAAAIRAELAGREQQKSNERQNLYIIGRGSFVKIGIAVNVRKRLAMLQTSSPVRLLLLKEWSCENARVTERRLHERFAKFKESGEWFLLPESVLAQLLSTERLD
jgi:hypothetical protein